MWGGLYAQRFHLAGVAVPSDLRIIGEWGRSRGMDALWSVIRPRPVLLGAIERIIGNGLGHGPGGGQYAEFLALARAEKPMPYSLTLRL